MNSRAYDRLSVSAPPIAAPRKAPITGGTERKLQLRVAEKPEREAIYRMRHSVYASELAQHSENPQGRLSDPLDNFNVYLIAVLRDQIVGFISITPPGHSIYSIDKYLSRDALPFTLDDRTYELRLLTVDTSHRRGKIAALLIYASFRWVEAHGGTRIVAIGRTDLLDFYRKTGLQHTGIQVHSGAITFELMSATISRAREFVKRHDHLLKTIVGSVDWQIGIPPTKSVPSFHGGAFFEAIGDDFSSLGKRRDIINADVLDAWFPPSPMVVKSIQEHLPWLLHTSPPTECDGMIRTIATTRCVGVECVLQGAGSSDLIYRAFPHWLTSTSRVLVIDPTYGEYVHVLENVVGCQVDRLFLNQQDGYVFEPSRLKQYFDTPYDLIIVVNPNNPTGLHAQREHLEDVLGRAPAQTRVWVDETYIEYVGDDQSLERFAAATKNVVVCKSMSKVYALSGLRVGYLCGSPEMLEPLRSLTPPWVVGLPAQLAAVIALQEPEYYQKRYRQTHELRTNLADQLINVTGFEVLRGVANFLLCRLPSNGTDAATLIERCREHGLFLRDASVTASRLGPKAFRIAVKDEATNHRMVEILQRVL